MLWKKLINGVGGRWWVLALAVGVLWGLMGTPVKAASSFEEDTVQINKNEVREGNYYIHAHQVIVDGIIKGDLVVAADSVTIRGDVQGSVLILASTADISGNVQGSVRGVLQDLSLSGQVASDVTVLTSHLAVTKTGIVQGSLYYLAGQEDIEGKVVGERKIIMGNQAQVPSGGEIAFAVLQSYLTLALLGVVVYSLQPYHLSEQLWEEVYKRFLGRLGVGLLTLFLLFPAGLLLLISGGGLLLVGRWVGLLIVSSVVVLGLLALVDASYFLGKLVLTRGRALPTQVILYFLLGAFLLTVLGSIPVLLLVPVIIWLAALGGRFMLIKSVIKK